MKKTLSVCVLLFFLTALNAQDIIVLRDATEIEAKVIEVTDAQISYKRFDNPDGPLYRKNTSDVLFVKYANGTKEVFNVSATANPDLNLTDNPAKRSMKKDSKNKDSLKLADFERPVIKRPIFNGYVEVSSDFGAYWGVGANVSLGCRINDYLYGGILIGLKYFGPYNYSWSTFDGMIMLPFQFDFRTLFPINQKSSYYLNLAFGPGVGWELGRYDSWYTPNFLIGMGFDVKRFTIGFGYEYFYRGNAPYYGFVKFGARIGKMK